MVHRHYFVPFFFFFQEAYFFPHHWRQLLELALVLILLTIWILDSLSLAHMVQIRMNSLSVLFWDRSLSSYFFNKLFEFWAYVNSFYHLDWSHSAQALFCSNFFISGSIFPSPSMKAVVGTYPCAYSLDHLDFIFFIYGSHGWNQVE